MAEFLAVDKDGSECKLFDTPKRGAQFWYGSKIAPEKLAKGTIFGLIGRQLSWEDEPIMFDLQSAVDSLAESNKSTSPKMG